MTWAAVPGWLVDLGAGSAALVAFLSLVGVVWRASRAFGHRLVAEIDERIAERVAPIEAQLRHNNGTSLRDVVCDGFDDLHQRIARVEVHVGLDPAAD
jgi:hypothetical protein